MLGTDEDEFLRIFCNHSFEQLRDIFNAYTQLAGHTMETAIEKEFSGDLLKVFSAIRESLFESLLILWKLLFVFNANLNTVWCSESFAKYYAIRLHSCIKGIGTDDQTLIRILITRSEVSYPYIEIKIKYLMLFINQWIDWFGRYQRRL